MDYLLDCLLDAGLDTAKLLPFLFVTYLAMEALERHAGAHQEQLIRHENAGVFGPVFGALAGIVPQCGFSAAASSLYAGGLISTGTLLAVFLSTSDEMLPLLISSQVPAAVMLRILAAKALTGMISGFAVDCILRFRRGHSVRKMQPERRRQEAVGTTPHTQVFALQLEEKHIHDLCEEEHCGCGREEGDILRAAVIHTAHIALFVLAISLVLNLAVGSLGEDAVRGILTGRPVAGVFLAAAVGLIPSCAASIIITQLYLDGFLAAGQMMAGLLVGAGVGLLVLFRTNARHLSENVKITLLLYALGVLWGLLFTMAGI